MKIEKLLSRYVKTYLRFRGISYTDRQIKTEINHNTKTVDIYVYTAICYQNGITVSFKDFTEFVRVYERGRKINKLLRNG